MGSLELPVTEEWLTIFKFWDWNFFIVEDRTYFVCWNCGQTKDVQYITESVN